MPNPFLSHVTKLLNEQDDNFVVGNPLTIVAGIADATEIPRVLNSNMSVWYKGTILVNNATMLSDEFDFLFYNIDGALLSHKGIYQYEITVRDEISQDVVTETGEFEI